MWEAVFSDVGVTLIAVLNAMRVLSDKRFIKRDAIASSFLLVILFELTQENNIKYYFVFK